MKRCAITGLGHLVTLDHLAVSRAHGGLQHPHIPPPTLPVLQAFMGLAALDKPAATRLLQAALSRPDDPAVDAPPGLLACRPAKLEAMLRAVERQGLEEPAAA